MAVERHTFKERTYACDAGHRVKALKWDYDPAPFCFTCPGASMREVFEGPGGTVMIQTDDIPGGMLVEHGICHADGTPKRYYSKSAMRRAANEAGLTIVGETPKVLQRHVDARGEAQRRQESSWT